MRLKVTCWSSENSERRGQVQPSIYHLCQDWLSNYHGLERFWLVTTGGIERQQRNEHGAHNNQIWKCRCKIRLNPEIRFTVKERAEQRHQDTARERGKEAGHSTVPKPVFSLYFTEHLLALWSLMSLLCYWSWQIRTVWQLIFKMRKLLRIPI